MRQAWPGAIERLRKALGISRSQVVPFAEWVSSLRQQHNEQHDRQQNQDQDQDQDQGQGQGQGQGTAAEQALTAHTNGNPATATSLADFLEQHFIRMSCGGVVLDMSKSIADCAPLRSVGPVDDALLDLYVRSWKEMGFL